MENRINQINTLEGIQDMVVRTKGAVMSRYIPVIRERLEELYILDVVSEADFDQLSDFLTINTAFGGGVSIISM